MLHMSCAHTSVRSDPRRVRLACLPGAGTLSVCHIPQASRALPEPSFLFNWMASHEPKQAAMLYAKLVAQHPHLPNVQVGVWMV